MACNEQFSPFFNENGVLSFYGYGKVEVGRKSKHCLVRYELDNTALLPPCFPCFLRIKDEKNDKILSETRITLSNFWFFIYHNKIALNSLPTTKEKRKRNVFDESLEECVMIELIEKTPLLQLEWNFD